MRRFNSLAYKSADEMVFGSAKHPVQCGFDLMIGNGYVLPEVNYTLPPITLSLNNIDKILDHYKDMTESILKRAVTLKVPGVLLEFEHLPEMTRIQEIGVRITELTKKLMEQFYEQFELKSALRVTVCDIRD